MVADTATDFVPSEKIHERQKKAEAEGWKPLHESGSIVVADADNFDAFAASAAHELRRRLLYRSDNGRMARGLVRNSGDLETIYLRNKGRPKVARLHSIVLNYTIVRRASHKVAERWVMGILFVEVLVDFPADTPPPVDPDVGKHADKIMVTRFLTRALLATDDMGCKGKSMAGVLERALELGYPGNLRMWYYSYRYVYRYLNCSGDEARLQPKGSRSYRGKWVGDHMPGKWQVFWLRGLTRRGGARMTPSTLHHELGEIYDDAYECDKTVVLYTGRYSGGMIDTLRSQFLNHYTELKQGKHARAGGEESIHHRIKDC